ncbi:MAG TPA: serine/threonine-protein kinase [Dermatophilaceae bacterium]|nr:serine/threonine-protein kinase [Dermatophilaceae bacterium]
MNNPPPSIAGHTHLRLISASGGYGDVHLYEETALGRRVALKVMRDSVVGTDAMRSFLAEANTMARLEHPNIVRVYGSGRTADGRPYLSMQFCPEDTYERRATTERLTVAEVLSTGVRVGSAVETAHRAGLLHRDIKPANILKTPWGAPGLTDFGVAHQMSNEDTSGNDVGVSVPWSPPEMLYTSTNGSPASDVYSLAATLWHLLVGRPPFWLSGGDNDTLATMSRIRDLPPQLTHRADVPESLERVLRHAMSKRPEQRPQTMAEFIRNLQAVENEMRWPVTESVITDVGGALTEVPRHIVATGQAAPSRPTTNHTVLRPKASGLDVSAFPVPNTPDPAAATKLRPTPTPTAPPARQSGTVLRARVTTVEVPQGPDPIATGGRRVMLVAVGVSLVLAAIVLGLILLPRGSGTAITASGPGSPPRTSVDAGAFEDAVPPGPVTIKAARVGREVSFTWDYSARLPTDEFRWQVEGGPPGTSKTPAVTLTAPSDARLCLKVIVVRVDGSGATRDWSPPVCG